MRWIAGMKDSSTKRLMYQVLFLTFFLQNALQKLLQFFFLSFYNFTKIEIKSFEYPKSIWKKYCLEYQTIGRWVIYPNEPVSQRIILKIVGFW